MVYISATEAARRLGVSEKTIRRWIQEKRLTAFHPHGYKNRLAIAEQDVEQKKRELAEFEQPGTAEQTPAASKDIIERLERVEHWLSDLQRWHSELEKRLEALEQGVSIPTHQKSEASSQPLQKKQTPAEPPKEIPSGSVGYAAFAEQHGVNERTARDQVDRGKIPAYVRTRPSNPRFKERWLEPAHQLAAIRFWQSHETRGFRTCPECPHDTLQEP